MVKRIIIMALLACLILGTAAAQRETARAHIATGQDHMRNQRYAEAVASFEAAIRLEPRNRQAPDLLRQAQERRMTMTFNQAQALHQEGNLNDAIVQYNQAIRFAPPGHSNIRMIQNRRDEAQRMQTENEQLAQEQSARERTETSRQLVQKANEAFIAGHYAVAVADYESAINIGGLPAAEVAEANRLIAEANTIQERMESYNRPLRDDDFEVLQNRDASITIIKFLASTTKTVRIAVVDHQIGYGITNVTIPGTLHGQRVTIIQREAFRNMGLVSVVIPNTVTEIGIGAFAGNRLERVTFGTALRFIRGGTPVGRAEVTEPGAFEGNSLLTTVILPDTVVEIGAKAFKDCGITNLTLGRAVAHIGESAFRNNKITNIALPPAIRRIQRFAFNTNQLTSLNIPNGIQQVWDDAFTNNPMTAIVLPASLSPMFQGQPAIGVDHELYGPNVPSFPDSVTRVTFPGGMQDRNLNGFHVSLRNFYISQGRRAGLYVKSDTADIWSRQ